jgi:hypothetical protein
MFRVWSDGSDVVVARQLHDVPAVLDRHYRVTGHSLRHACWQEIHDDVLPLRRANAVHRVPVSTLTAVACEAWVGRMR